MIGTIPREERGSDQVLPSENYIRKAMPQNLSTFDMTMVFLMVIFFISNPVQTAGAGSAAFIYWIIGALIFFLPSVIATAQLGTMFFQEGSLYNWTQKALGDFWGFFVGVSFWASGVLGMVGSAGIVVSLLQGINKSWLAEPRVQGVFIVFILILAAILSMQRYRTLQYVVNYIAIIMLCVIALLGLAALIWLATGHTASTMAHTGNMVIQPGNFVVFSTVILAFLGANVSMIIGGEMPDRKAVPRHLFRGSLLVLACYLVVIFALIVVEGPQAASLGPISIINVINQVFGQYVADIAVVCVITFFLVLTALLNSIFARLLLLGALDRRLPLGLGQLDENRVPLNAIVFQTTIAVLFTALVFLMPYLVSLGNPVNLTNELFTVSLYAHSIIWAISSAFLFINLMALYFRSPRAFHEQRIFPMPVLWICIIIPPVVCVVAIIDTLLYSPIPQLISSSLWGAIVGGLTLLWLLIAAVASMVANGQAGWEDYAERS